MWKSKSISNAVGIITCFIVLSGVSGCNDGEDIKNWVENTNKLQVKAKTQAEIVPYRQEQHQALKEYFTEIANVALSLKNDSKFAERFNSAAAKENINDICSKVLISRTREWENMVQRCTRNGFFLCAEEVRAYPEIIATIRGKLTTDLQKKFDQANYCRAAQERR